MKNVLDNPVINHTINKIVQIDKNGLVRWNNDALAEEFIFLMGDVANGRQGDLILTRDPDPAGRSKIVLCGYDWCELDQEKTIRASYYANATHRGYAEFLAFAKSLYAELGVEYNRDKYATENDFLDEAINEYIWPCIVRALTLRHAIENLK